MIYACIDLVLCIRCRATRLEVGWTGSIGHWPELGHVYRYRIEAICRNPVIRERIAREHAACRSNRQRIVDGLAGNPVPLRLGGYDSRQQGAPTVPDALVIDEEKRLVVDSPAPQSGAELVVDEMRLA